MATRDRRKRPAAGEDLAALAWTRAALAALPATLARMPTDPDRADIQAAVSDAWDVADAFIAEAAARLRREDAAESK